MSHRQIGFFCELFRKPRISLDFNEMGTPPDRMIVQLHDRRLPARGATFVRDEAA
jgi:hypothetical protein